MTGRELTAELGKLREALGRLEGRVVAMRDAVLRDLSKDYFSEDFDEGIDEAIGDIRDAAKEIEEAVDDLDARAVKGEDDED